MTDHAATPSAAPWAIVLIVALLLRLPLAWFELYHHPDEVWQYLEPAHGLLTGHAVVPWEYRAGIRPWLIPTLLAGPMWLGRTLMPAAYLVPVRLTLILLSLSVVLFGGLIAARRSRRHGLVTAACLATSFELVYFSARALSDSLALVTLLPALWLMGREHGRARDWLLAGALLGVTFVLRFQLTPALGVAALLGARRDLRRWRGLAAGALAGLALGALADLVNGAPPLLWVVRNVTQNVVVNRSAAYGVLPAWWYPVEQVRVWGWASLVMVPALVVGARRAPGLLAIALVNIAAHSLIGHKEYRFVLASSTLFTLLAGIGLGDALAALPQRRRKAGMVAAAMLWLGCAAAVASSPGGRRQWSSHRRSIRSWRMAAAQPGSCGFALLSRQNLLVPYTYYDRDAPIYSFRFPRELPELLRNASGFDVVLGPKQAAATLAPPFHLVRCFPDKEEAAAGLPPQTCLFVRLGACAGPVPPRFTIAAALRRDDL